MPPDLGGLPAKIMEREHVNRRMAAIHYKGLETALAVFSL